MTITFSSLSGMSAGAGVGPGIAGQAGRPVVLVDDLWDSGCVLIAPAASIEFRTVAEMVRLGTGFLCVTVDVATAHRLDLPPMAWQQAAGGAGERMCVSVDAVAGTTTGISAHDRAVTMRALADPDARAESFSRPGHVVPVVVADDAPSFDRVGLIARAGRYLTGQTSALSAVVYADLVSQRDDTQLARLDEAAEVGLPTLTYSSLVALTP